MAFSLEDEGHNWKVIYSGDKQIGRVCQHADGSYLGLVGKYITIKGCRTEKEAFNEAVAQHLRHSNYKKKHHKENPKQRITAPQYAKPKPQYQQPMTNVRLFTAERFTATKALMRPRQYQPEGAMQ